MRRFCSKTEAFYSPDIKASETPGIGRDFAFLSAETLYRGPYIGAPI